MKIDTQISENQRKVLKVLAEDFRADSNCWFFLGIAKKTGLTIRVVRLACRALARKGLAQYQRGLFDDDGMVAGSGYCSTYNGAMLIDACTTCHNHLSSFTTGECEDCYHKRDRSERMTRLKGLGIATGLLGEVSNFDLGLLEKEVENSPAITRSSERILRWVNTIVAPYGRRYDSSTHNPQ